MNYPTPTTILPTKGQTNLGLTGPWSNEFP
jgi:hypothetical protein